MSNVKSCGRGYPSEKILGGLQSSEEKKSINYKTTYKENYKKTNTAEFTGKKVT
jgi:hypothetical protein